MRKILIIILGTIFGMALYIAITSGIEVFGFAIPSLKTIQAQDVLLDKMIDNLGKQTSIEFPKANSDLQERTKELGQAKSDYASLIVDNQSQVLEIENKIKTYHTEFLWIRIGNYAKEEGVSINIDAQPSGSSINGKKKYNLNFIVNGNYVAISSFLSHLEQDTQLEFSIENFQIQPSETTNNSNLRATFVVKDIAINGNDVVSRPLPDMDTNQNTNTNTNTLTNKTTNTNTNTINTTNTIYY